MCRCHMGIAMFCDLGDANANRIAAEIRWRKWVGSVNTRGEKREDERER